MSAGISAGIGPDTRQLSGPAGLAINATVGGLVSVAGGGKFANGAVTGAFAYLISPTGSASEQSVDAGTSGRESAVAQPRYASADTMMAQQELGL